MTIFYDQLAPFYHLVHQDWNASLVRQGCELGSLIESGWPGRRKVLDVTCGIGTQAIALALQGYSVTASDLSAREIERAREEVGKRGLDVALSVCDVRQAHAHHGAGFDVVISCDNSLPHLLTDDDLAMAFSQMLACLVVGGGCIVTVRDYAQEERGKNLVKPLIRLPLMPTFAMELLAPGGAYFVFDHFSGKGGMTNDQLYMTVAQQREALAAAGFGAAEQLFLKGGMMLHRATLPGPRAS